MVTWAIWTDRIPAAEEGERFGASTCSLQSLSILPQSKSRPIAKVVPALARGHAGESTDRTCSNLRVFALSRFTPDLEPIGAGPIKNGRSKRRQGTIGIGLTQIVQRSRTLQRMRSDHAGSRPLVPPRRAQRAPTRRVCHGHDPQPGYRRRTNSGRLSPEFGGSIQQRITRLQSPSDRRGVVDGGSSIRLVRCKCVTAASKTACIPPTCTAAKRMAPAENHGS